MVVTSYNGKRRRGTAGKNTTRVPPKDFWPGVKEDELGYTNDSLDRSKKLHIESSSHNNENLANSTAPIPTITTTTTTTTMIRHRRRRRKPNSCGLSAKSKDSNSKLL